MVRMTAMTSAPGARGRLGLRRVLVDVAGGDDDVDIRLQRLADLGHQFVAPAPHRIDTRHALGGEFLAAGLGRRTALGRRLGDGDLAGGYALRD